ncbi:MAG: RNA methyltransferase [Prochlorococcus sp.]|nr:RNA methyltransferase [Prochlorococcaceae cyanobacterium ETNP2_MAG_10]MDP6203308.1 RNA methyltransferase [Prochlorococcaceae cyanobacterium ETNP18_MAG_14]MDP6310158.1 RNA methyltransferase [Prochlorococcaceae cyanobacterium ETNP14_MAG_4]HJM80131.1 RNA methyltransferase [Prochlorococcaceae cyanobacterium Fu_MAG_72]
MNKQFRTIPTTVVLVEPSGPLNVGSVARLCANFGVQELRLVSPRCDPSDSEARRMAVHGIAMLEQAKQFSCLLDAVADCRRVVASCGRSDHGDIPLQSPEQALPWLINSIGQEPVALVFGREDRGLTNKELLLAQRVLTLHSSSGYPSLNLSHAVAVVLHELQRCKLQQPLSNEQSAFPDPASPRQLDAYLADAQTLLLEVGFLLEHTAQARMAKVRGLLQRAAVRPQEVALLRGMVRQIRWAIHSRHS